MAIAALLAGASLAATSVPAPRATGDPGTASPPSATIVAFDVPYGPSPSERLDVHVAPGREAAPAVVVVHGGGWSGGDRRRMTAVSDALAQAGLAAFNVDYSLARPWRPGFGLQLAELRRAVRWVRRNATRFGADADRVGALGSSAGGHLAALLAASWPSTTRRPVDAVVTWSAPLDLPALASGGLAGAVNDYLGCSPRVCPRRATAASPLWHVGPGDPPMMIVNSTREVTPIGQARAMAARLAQARVRRVLWSLPGTLHAREYSPLVLPASIAFLRSSLR